MFHFTLKLQFASFNGHKFMGVQIVQDNKICTYWSYAAMLKCGNL